MPKEQFNSPKQETILNDWDRRILLEGGAGVVKKILEQQGMPDVIILPETSARPLFYLLDPIFKKAGELLSKKSPKYIFLNVNHGDEQTRTAELSHNDWKYDDVYKSSLSEQELFDYIKTSYQYLPEESELNNAELSDLRKNIKTTYDKRVTEKSRAHEMAIKAESFFGENFHVVVIDDFSAEGQTKSEINRAFGKQIPYYTIFTDQVWSMHSDEQSGLALPSSDTGNPTGGGRLRFSYSVDKPNGGIGVKKNSGEMYSIPFHKLKFYTRTAEDVKKMEQLRKEMSAIGAEAAKSIDFLKTKN